MSQRTEIKVGMRAILIDWLIQVHNRFRLLQETLYITISIVDRFLSVSGELKLSYNINKDSCLFLNCNVWVLKVNARVFS